MKSIRLILLLIVISISSCSTDDDVSKVEPVIVTINVKSTFPAVGRQWTFVTNSHEDVISSQKLSIGSNKFTGTVPDIINVRFFEYSIDTQSFYRFTTYPNVSPNSVVTPDQSQRLWMVFYSNVLAKRQGWRNKFRGDNQYISISNNNPDLVTGIHTEHPQAFQMYPNPADASITISDAVNLRSVTIRDVRGRTFSRSPNQGVSAKVSLEGLPAGIYLIEVVDQQGTTTITRVVKK